MSTVDTVKYHLYKDMIPRDPKVLRSMVALAYHT